MRRDENYILPGFIHGTPVHKVPVILQVPGGEFLFCFEKLLVKFRQVFHVTKCSYQLKNWAGIYKNISRTWRPGNFYRIPIFNHIIFIFLVTMKN